jgi:succinate dehydrogenase / fumarate reductase, cytochrome b subunit
VPDTAHYRAPAQSVQDAARLRWVREVWRSTIGKKVLVAISGGILGLYVVLHALGNLKAFQGPGGGDPAIDRYSEWLRTVGGPAIPRSGALWIVRVILIGALVVHVAAIASLTRRNRAARPPGYRSAPRLQRSLSARTMLFTGLVVLAFVVFHILQFTTGTVQATPIVHGEVYTNLYNAFQKWYFVLIYVAAVALLGLHLWHALWSVAQTLGWNKPNRNPTFRRAAIAIAVSVAAGFAAVPICFWTGILPGPSHAEVQALVVKGR